ncbi:MAG: putative ribosomal RNA small subunit methyltransferase A [Candidatus Woesebacteria bacterium GW2011_GWB1_38_5b]|uniref:Putative ribosomal RNA small subunit methyltransferase A n=1 Tax=Candidatus Woesebacteria bacterium GW2011_GWB1_38_5b TaxID=1618569 RepID=A0A0G0KFE4_9BACT|nr:MAG: putative ribosomal RNA small subunit methyltransferase A [Candidatus Woesebacteria bacterium GW2011_GWB1_38_5b]
MNIFQELQRYNIKPDVYKDQFFLTDKKIIKEMVGFAELNSKDVVLEVGAGTGNLTSEIAKYAERLIAFEIDKRFKPFLDKLPARVEMHYENAWEYVQLHGMYKKKKVYNKIIANPPYSFIEQFLHNLTFLEYDKVILVVPIKIVDKIQKNPIFGSFFKARILLRVPKEKFSPVPKTNSAVIDLVKLPDPAKSKNPGLFLRQYMYQREDKLTKNSLMEGLIDYAKLVHLTKLTKNEARKIIAKSGIDEKLLNTHPKGEIYNLVGEGFKKLL